MRTRMYNRQWMALAVAASLGLLLTVMSATSARASEPPPGDCWNEALSQDKLHCYLLEEAQRAGAIEVAAVYVAPGGGPLHIFLEQTTHITDEMAQLFETKAHEYMEKESPAASHYRHECGDYTGDERKDCFNSFLKYPFWREFGMRLPGAYPHHAVPLSKNYENILIHVGGSDERRKVPGWASWTQLWPAAAPGPGGSTGFDVSDVDLTNIPDPDCEDIVGGYIGRACHSWQLDTSVGVAGVFLKHRYDVQPDLEGNKIVVESLEAVYLQLKVSDPDDEEEMQALRDRLHPDTFGPDWEVITIPVKYDFGELWRWSVVLERFGVSAGNTVGITGAEVVINGTGHGFNEEPRVWLNGVEPLRRDSTGSGDDPDTVRTILMVWAVDPHLAAEALPELLPELGIPADAVGVVKHDNTTPVILRYASGRVGTNSDGVPNSVDTTSDDYGTSQIENLKARVGVDSDGNPISVNFGGRSYPPTRTESAAVQSPNTSPPREVDMAANDASSQGAPSNTEANATTMDVQSSDFSKTRAPGSNSASDPPLPAQGVSMWILAGGAIVMGLVVLGAGVGVSLGLRRLSS